MTHRPTAEQLIARFGLEALPVEGGLFRQWYRSSTLLAPDLHGVGPDPKPMGTAIVVLLPRFASARFPGSAAR